jgi:GNAT superfamily N-acetyltransferase
MPFANHRITLGPDAEAMAQVRTGLEAFNRMQIGDYAYQDFALYARDAEDRVVGGMFGHSGMGWLYIDYLWLADDQRGNGLGAHLLGLAEDEARRRGCSGVFLYTYSFQAPGFYKKQGFELMGVLEDCPPGHQRFYLKKQLARD